MSAITEILRAPIATPRRAAIFIPAMLALPYFIYALNDLVRWAKEIL